MTTASQLLDAAMKEITVGAAEASISASDAADFIYALNNYMEGQLAAGLDLNWTTITNISDTIVITQTVDTVTTDKAPGCIEPLTKIMAVRIAPQFGAPVPAELTRQAMDAQGLIDRIGAASITMAYPDTLPRGGGNANGRYLYEDDFYSGSTE